MDMLKGFKPFTKGMEFGKTQPLPHRALYFEKHDRDF